MHPIDPTLNPFTGKLGERRPLPPQQAPKRGVVSTLMRAIAGAQQTVGSNMNVRVVVANTQPLYASRAEEEVGQQNMWEKGTSLVNVATMQPFLRGYKDRRAAELLERVLHPCKRGKTNFYYTELKIQVHIPPSGEGKTCKRGSAGKNGGSF